MKKLIFLLLSAMLAFQPIGFSAWDDTAPAGTSNVSDIDANVIANNQALESTLSGVTGWANLKVTTGGSATTVTVTADMLLLQASASIATRITSVNEAIAITTSGASGLVTALEEAANTIYYVWIARKSADGTVNGYLSTTTSLTTFLTQVDAGYDQAALVSAVGNNGSSNILDFTQMGKYYYFKTLIALSSGSTSDVWTSVDTTPATLSFFVPTAISSIAFGSIPTGAGGYGSGISSDSGGGIFLSNDYLNGASDNYFYWELPIFTTDTLWYRGAHALNAVYIYGFILNKI